MKQLDRSILNEQHLQYTYVPRLSCTGDSKLGTEEYIYNFFAHGKRAIPSTTAVIIQTSPCRQDHVGIDKNITRQASRNLRSDVSEPEKTSQIARPLQPARRHRPGTLRKTRNRTNSIHRHSESQESLSNASPSQKRSTVPTTNRRPHHPGTLGKKVEKKPQPDIDCPHMLPNQQRER